MKEVVGDNKNSRKDVVYPVSDSTATESIIQRTIEGIQRMIKPYDGNDDDGYETTKAVIEINPAMKRHWESEIKILRYAPRDEKKLRAILKAKQEEYDKAEDSEDIDDHFHDQPIYGTVNMLSKDDAFTVTLLTPRSIQDKIEQELGELGVNTARAQSAIENRGTQVGRTFTQEAMDVFSNITKSIRDIMAIE